MKYQNESCAESLSSAAEQVNDFYDYDVWYSCDDALDIVCDRTEEIKDVARKCIETHFSLEEQEWIGSQIVPVYTDPNAGTNCDDDAVYVRFEVYDVEGDVSVQLEIYGQGRFMLKYRTDGTEFLIDDDMPVEYRFDGKPGRSNTVVKWALFTTALTYLLFLGHDDIICELLDLRPHLHEDELAEYYLE